MRKCLLAMLILMLVILMLIRMLLNLNTGYADTDADLCIRIMYLIVLYYQIQLGCITWKMGIKSNQPLDASDIRTNKVLDQSSSQSCRSFLAS